MRDARDSFGQPVEEFEIQFIDGEHIDCDLAKAWELNQANMGDYLRISDEWDDDQKLRFIIAVGECGYSFDPGTVSPDDFDVDVYFLTGLQDLAVQFVDEGLFGDVPQAFAAYIDYDAIARDLACDHSETTIANERLVYRCG